MLGKFEESREGVENGVSARARSAVWLGPKLLSLGNGGMGCKRAEDDGSRKNGNAQD